jgi:putative transposase
LHRGSKPLAIHCMPDHAHIFIGYKPTIHIPDLVKEIKVETNEFVNQKKFTPFKFSWQEGYGVFSYSQSHIGRVMNYVNNQESRHAKTPFRVEYLDLLKAFDISFEEKYVFEFFD